MIKIRFTEDAIKRAKAGHYKSNEFVLKHGRRPMPVSEIGQIRLNGYLWDLWDFELLPEYRLPGTIKLKGFGRAFRFGFLLGRIFGFK